MKHIELCIAATTMCDRGCAHCITMANRKNAVHFSLANMEKILFEVRDYEKVRVVFTGGGEPLLNPNIVGLFDLCHGFLGERLFEISLVTSGVLPEEESQEERFLELIERHYASKIKLAISFNLFQEKFPKRLENTLAKLAVFGENIRRRTIRMCLSCENFGRTYWALAKVLERVEILTATYIREFLVDNSDPLFIPGFFLYDKWSEERYRWLSQDAFLFRHLVLMYNTKRKYARGLFIEPFSVEKLGKAAQIKATPIFRENPKCSFLFKKTMSSLPSIFVAAKGFLVPACNCLELEEMNFGNLGEISLQEHFKRKEILRRGLLRHMLLDSREYNLRQVCKICAGYRQTMFDF